MLIFTWSSIPFWAGWLGLIRKLPLVPKHLRTPDRVPLPERGLTENEPGR
jgi:hypothetical protein